MSLRKLFNARSLASTTTAALRKIHIKLEKLRQCDDFVLQRECFHIPQASFGPPIRSHFQINECLEAPHFSRVVSSKLSITHGSFTAEDFTAKYPCYLE